MLKTLQKPDEPVNLADKNIDEDSCPAWQLVEPDRQTRQERARLSRAMMAVEGSNEVERLLDTSDFDKLYADLRQVALDMAATWLGYWQARAERLRQYMETQGVSVEILEAITNEGQAILRFLAAVGRLR